MNLNRLLKYGELLAKGAVEAQRIISENYTAKLKIMKNIKSGFAQRIISENYTAKSKIIKSMKPDPFGLSQSRVELVELIKKDKEIFERVKRWVESKESNTALKMLEDGMDLELSSKLIKKLSNIIDFNKKDHKILMKLGIVLDNQEEWVKEMYRFKPTKFEKMFEKSLKKQHKYFEELNYYSAKSLRLLKGFLKEARLFTFIFNCNIAWSGYDHFQNYLETGDVTQLELFKGSIVIIVTATILTELLQGMASIPQFTKPIKEYFSKY